VDHHDLAARTGTRGTPPLALLHAVDTVVAGDLGQDAALLADAAAVLTARQQLDELLTELAARPFSASAYDGLRAYLAGPADQAVAAYERVCTCTARRT
jgi:hypothetical protein